ncbi:aminoglycoside phosphotransferase family protein [uncultured Devosia sp.]|uniref:phosphotransferase family protein n=1 Tax=uncultured Devosia sp. TaxID=211434 RepID=UPI0026178CDF|nr:aminoglycoside phosphotransferase family protein [uncultured Devosia sp.]
MELKVRLAFLLAAAFAAYSVAVAALSTNQITLWPLVGVLVSAAVGLGINIFNRWDTQGDRRRLKAEIITLLSAEMHNFTRQHATNLSKLSQLLGERITKRDVLEALERFSFRGRPGSGEEELFKVTSVEQLAHLPRFLSRDFMRVHIIARNLERDIERTLSRIRPAREVGGKFQSLVTDELYRLGLRLERATVQGQLLLERLEAYENRNPIVRYLRSRSRRWSQRAIVSKISYRDRPMQPDDTRAYEELSRWRDLVQRRSSVPASEVLEVAALVEGGQLTAVQERHEGTFNQVFVVRSAERDLCIRRKKNKEIFRYDQSIFKESFVGKLYELTDDGESITSEVLRSALIYAESKDVDFFNRGVISRYPGPDIYGFGVHLGHQYVVSEWFEGQTGASFSTPRNYYELGCIIAAMHDRKFARALTSLEKDGLEARAYLEAVKKEIIDRNESSGLIVERGQLEDWVENRMTTGHQSFEGNHPFVLCHNDLHPFNLFLTRSGIRIIDWDNTVISHPYLDFVKPKYWSDVSNGRLAGSGECFKKFTEGYSRILEGMNKRPLPEMNIDPIFQLHEMLWLFRIWTFETGRLSKGATDLGPFQPPGYYEPIIWDLARR